MRAIKHILFLSLIVVFNGCISAPIKPHIQAAHAVSQPYIKKVCKTHNLSVLGTGGRMMNQVEDISVSFIALTEFDINQAREHFVAIALPLVQEIEQSLELKHYLAHPDNPETAANISVTYKNSNGIRPSPPLIAHAMMLDGKIYYSISDSPTSPYRDVYEETYQEALSKINLKTN